MSQAEFRQLFAARAHTFFFAARFLPADRQEAVTALYAFCRVRDALAEECRVAEGAPARAAGARGRGGGERGALPPPAPPLPQFDRDAGKALAEALLAVVRRHAVP